MRIYYHIPHMMTLDELLATGLLPGAGDDMLRFGGIKIFADGGDGPVRVQARQYSSTVRAATLLRALRV